MGVGQLAKTSERLGPGFVLLLVFPLLAASLLIASEPSGYLEGLNGLPPEELRSVSEAVLPDGPQGSSKAPRLVILVLDGLRLDRSREMPALQALRAQGADWTLKAPFPSFSKPAYVTLATGVAPRWSGVRNNRYTGRVPLDSLLDRARAVGRGTHCVLDTLDWWASLLTPGCQRSEVTTGAAQFLDAMRGALNGPADVLLLHWLGIDSSGHSWGGGSAQYRAAVRDADLLVEQIQGSLDQRPTLFAVVSDHGHSRNGGHGGVEPLVLDVPFVLTGPGVRAGARGTAHADGVAGTLALLAGLELPHSAAGELIAGATTLPDAVLGRAQHRLASARRKWEQADASPDGWRWGRLLGALALLALLILGGRQLTGRLPPWGFVGGFWVSAGIALLMLGRGDPLSFSAVDDASRFMGRIMGYLGAVGIPVLIVVFRNLFKTRAKHRLAWALGVVIAWLPGGVGPWLLSVAWAGPRPFPALPEPAIIFLPVLSAVPAAATLFAGALLIFVASCFDGGGGGQVKGGGRGSTRGTRGKS